MASPEDKKAFLLRIDPALWAEIEPLGGRPGAANANEVDPLLLTRSVRARGVAPKAPAKPTPKATP